MRVDPMRTSSSVEPVWAGATGPGVRHAATPPGFTLVELLVVVAIVALIATLSIGALMMVPERARVRGTEALIKKLDGRLAQKLEAFDQQRQSLKSYPADQWFDA